jgi:hypothetical protein
MNTAIERVETGAMQEYSVEDVVAQVQKIQSIMGKVMQDGEHYGKIPGCGPKPTLLKPGAEKLGFTFRLAPRFYGEEQPRDLGHGHREYVIRCELYHIPSGAFVGSGVGSCSTMESKYRYRSGPTESTGRPVPGEYWNARKTDPEKAQNLLGGKGFIAHKNEEGKWEVFVKGEKMENPDPADNYNTVLKMAKKRAHVDAILTATAASDIFTQDVEDLAETPPKAPKDETAAAPGGPVQNNAAAVTGDQGQSEPTPASKIITEAQRKRMYALARGSGMNDAQFKGELERMGYKSSKDVLVKDYQDICQFFENWKP